nr:sensor domain-containing diguanylate cyclase [Herbaspirillum rhizosphaerae]
MMCGLCAWVLYKSHEEARHYAVETSQNITLIAQRDIVRNIEILSLSLDALANRYQNPMFATLTHNQQHSYLFGSTLAAKHVVVMAVLDPTGKVSVSSLPGAPANTYGDRPYFTIQRDQPDTGLYISRPIVAKFAKDMQVIVLSKRLSKSDGSFAGVVVMALDLAYFRELFSGVALGENGVMSLYSSDGVVYMRLPYSQSLIGRDISSSASFAQIRPLMQQDSGSFSARALSDGVQRLYAFRRIPDTQLVVFVGRAETDIYKHWIDNLYTIVAMMFLFAPVCMVLFWILRKELKKRVEAEEKLRQLARVDGLTSLLNRRALDDMLRDLWNRNRRSNGIFSILFIDVDYFKFYNDTYGHQKGDDVLVSVARAISAQLPRSSDIAARYGGEEFIAVLPETDRDGAALVGEKIRSAIEALGIPHSKSQSGHVTASIGAATYEHGAHDSIEAVLSAADGALYAAKGKGRNNVQSSGALADLD